MTPPDILTLICDELKQLRIEQRAFHDELSGWKLDAEGRISDCETDVGWVKGGIKISFAGLLSLLAMSVVKLFVK